MKTEVDGHKFASKKEARRYGELRLLQKAGEIRGLRLQPRYCLCAANLAPIALHDVNAGIVGPRRIIVAEYVADFEYEEKQNWRAGMMGAWERVIEDCKGFRTPTYRLKAKWFEAQYGVTIRET